jgi:hypothetical protein
MKVLTLLATLCLVLTLSHAQDTTLEADRTRERSGSNVGAHIGAHGKRKARAAKKDAEKAAEGKDVGGATFQVNPKKSGTVLKW